jgi:hypothetical protein
MEPGQGGKRTTMFSGLMQVVAACIAIYGLRTWRLQLT